MLAFCVISCSLRLHFELPGQLCRTYTTSAQFSRQFRVYGTYIYPLALRQGVYTRIRYSAVRMGIQGLMKLIADYAPSAMKDHEIKSYFGECPTVGP